MHVAEMADHPPGARASVRRLRNLFGTLMALLLTLTGDRSVSSAPVETWGSVQGPDVDGTISLRLEPDGGAVGGTIEMTVRFDCRGKGRDERHVLEIRGRVEGDRIRGTALYVERSGLPKDELSRCRSAYETYASRKDSRAFIGTVDAAGTTASGTLGEYRPTVSWRVAWTAPAPEVVLHEAPPAEPAPDSPAPASDLEPGQVPTE